MKQIKLKIWLLASVLALGMVSCGSGRTKSDQEKLAATNENAKTVSEEMQEDWISGNWQHNWDPGNDETGWLELMLTLSNNNGNISGKYLVFHDGSSNDYCYDNVNGNLRDNTVYLSFSVYDEKMDVEIRKGNANDEIEVALKSSDDSNSFKMTRTTKTATEGQVVAEEIRQAKEQRYADLAAMWEEEKKSKPLAAFFANKSGGNHLSYDMNMLLLEIFKYVCDYKGDSEYYEFMVNEFGAVPDWPLLAGRGKGHKNLYSNDSVFFRNKEKGINNGYRHYYGVDEPIRLEELKNQIDSCFYATRYYEGTKQFNGGRNNTHTLYTVVDGYDIVTECKVKERIFDGTAIEMNEERTYSEIAKYIQHCLDYTLEPTVVNIAMFHAAEMWHFNRTNAMTIKARYGSYTIDAASSKIDPDMANFIKATVSSSIEGRFERTGKVTVTDEEKYWLNKLKQ
jgi:cupin superfamily acireductone dioxygenase involved in methionine salvage